MEGMMTKKIIITIDVERDISKYVKNGFRGIEEGLPRLLEILKDSEHEDYEHYHEWAGDGFDPEEFDVDKVNDLFERS